MPSVKLSRYECRQNLLPDVCMFCGKPSTQKVQRNFAWYPGWVLLILLLSLLIGLIIALILTKRMPVLAPACHRHAGFWKRRTAILLSTFLLVAGFCVGSAIVYEPMGFGPLGNYSSGLPIICIFLVLSWLIVAVIFASRGVRPTEITDSEIRLAGVNAQFVAALRELRGYPRSERGRYGDERDDYDDEMGEVDRRTPPRDRDRRDDDDERPRRKSRYDD